MTRPFDEVDKRIAALLSEQGRLSFTELARRVHLSTPALIVRVRRLEDAGVIRGYQALVDRAWWGCPFSVHVLLTCTRSMERRFRDDLDSYPEITDCSLVTGEASFVLAAALDSLDHVNEFLERLGRYGETNTLTVLEQLVARPLPQRR